MAIKVTLKDVWEGFLATICFFSTKNKNNQDSLMHYFH